MKILGVIDEDFINYKKTSMVIEFPFCDFKCEKECGEAVCQNSPLAHQPLIEVEATRIIDRYLKNPITSAIVMQGLEPFMSFDSLYYFIARLRWTGCSDDVVIYTGYNKNEIALEIAKLSSFGNIIIKFGRFIPNQKTHYDEVLGVYLASDNQYAERIC